MKSERNTSLENGLEIHVQRTRFLRLVVQGVRQIAHDLHQMLRKTISSPDELIELKRRIDELRVHTHGTGLIAIDRWLANSRSAIRARAVAEQTSTADKYTSARRCPAYTTSC